MEGREEGVASCGEARKGGRTKKTHTRVNRVFRLTMHSACKRKTEKDRERERGVTVDLFLCWTLGLQREHMERADPRLLVLPLPCTVDAAFR